MSGVQRLRRAPEDSQPRPVLAPAGNKARPPERLACKFDRDKVAGDNEKAGRYPGADPRGIERLVHSDLSPSASFSSDCSTESLRSRASTGRIGAKASLSGGRRMQGVESGKVGSNAVSSPQEFQGKRRCAWITPNTEMCYVVFHDEEWGVPVHDDKKLFELLVLSSALAEITWPTILGKRHTFREVFADFDPLAVSKLNEKKITAPGSIARSLLSEPKLRAVIENARLILKIIVEFGSFAIYIWSFVNHTPIIANFRYSRQVPAKTAKADAISKELVRRGFRGVGPTVVYSFMQAAGMTNDHLTTCFRFQECCTPALPLVPSNADGTTMLAHSETAAKIEEDSSLSATDTTTTAEQEDLNFDLELATAVGNLDLS